jgi:hypothetical protein
VDKRWQRGVSGHDGEVSRKPLEPAVRPAQRVITAGWRDPRLWVGVALVAGSVVAGSQVLASADDTTAVWAAAAPLSPGETITAGDLVEVRVKFADAGDAQRYVTVDDQFPDDVTLDRPLGAGELLPASALGADPGDAVVSVALSLPPEEVPHGLSEGSRVDVWVIGEDRPREAEADLVLDDVAVLAVPSASGAFGASGSQQVVLAVPEDDSDALATVLAAGHERTVRIVGRTAP